MCLSRERGENQIHPLEHVARLNVVLIRLYREILARWSDNETAQKVSTVHKFPNTKIVSIGFIHAAIHKLVSTQ